MPEQNQQYLNQEGLTALWEKIRNRDAQLSAAVSAISTAVSSTVPDLSVSGLGGVSGVLGISGGGLGVTAWNAARDAQHLDVYTKSEVDSLLNGKVEVVASLPASGEPGKIYYVGPTGTGDDKYDEYIWDSTNNTFIHVGEHSIDLSDYVNTVSVTGAGNAITTTAKSGNTLTLGKDQTFVLSSDYTATIGGMTTAYTTEIHKVITAISQSSGTITSIGQTQLGVSDIDGLDTITGNIEDEIQYISGAVSSLEEQGDEFTEAIESLNNRMTSAEDEIINLNSAIDLLNGRIEDLEEFQEEVTDAFTAMNITFTSNPWETITAVTSQSGQLQFGTATIPSIPITAIENLNDSWIPAPTSNAGEGE